jgi:hypothetical protein
MFGFEQIIVVLVFFVNFTEVYIMMIAAKMSQKCVCGLFVKTGRYADVPPANV